MIEFEFVSPEKLEKCYHAWKAIMAKRQSDPSEPLSFHSGVVFEEEGYKYDIIKQGKEILGRFDWSASQLVGSGKIVQLALELLAIRPNHGDQQNLVDYRDIMYLADQAYSNKLKDIEKALYLLYAEGNEKDAFNLLAHTLTKKYALISYFFFLKNSDEYQVVRPNNFAERFPLLGADSRCALNCSWDNYRRYMSVLCDVKKFLEQHHTDITLTDAHSFVWMLWMLNR